jgi:hypothetical protein
MCYTLQFPLPRYLDRRFAVAVVAVVVSVEMQ